MGSVPSSCHLPNLALPFPPILLSFRSAPLCSFPAWSALVPSDLSSEEIVAPPGKVAQQRGNLEFADSSWVMPGCERLAFPLYKARPSEPSPCAVTLTVLVSLPVLLARLPPPWAANALLQPQGPAVLTRESGAAGFNVGTRRRGLLQLACPLTFARPWSARMGGTGTKANCCLPLCSRHQGPLREEELPSSHHPSSRRRWGCGAAAWPAPATEPASDFFFPPQP